MKKKRVSLSRKVSRKLYKRTVNITKSKNLSPPPMRGGIRL